MNVLARYSPLVASAGLFLTAATESGNTAERGAWFTAGLISFGAWLALEVTHVAHRMRQEHSATLTERKDGNHGDTESS